jgi:hypothetical protein
MSEHFAGEFLFVLFGESFFIVFVGLFLYSALKWWWWW